MDYGADFCCERVLNERYDTAARPSARILDGNGFGDDVSMAHGHILEAPQLVRTAPAAPAAGKRRNYLKKYKAIIKAPKAQR